MEVADGGSGSGPLGQAGYAFTGSGGGGAGGQYVFTSLEQLDDIIGQWEALHGRIRLRGDKLRRAIGLIEPPAEDIMSKMQADAAKVSLQRAEAHRLAMENYAREYVDKLKAARADYAATEADNTSAVRRAGEELGG